MGRNLHSTVGLGMHGIIALLNYESKKEADRAQPLSRLQLISNRRFSAFSMRPIPLPIALLSNYPSEWTTSRPASIQSSRSSLHSSSGFSIAVAVTADRVDLISLALHLQRQLWSAVLVHSTTVFPLALKTQTLYQQI
jgi:hypothetical protein